MKIENIIRRVLREEQEEEKLLKIPSLKFFNNDWNVLQMFLESQGNPRYSIGGDLDLSYSDIESLGNLVRVEGDLDLYECKNTLSLGDLEYVGGDLNLLGNKGIESLGNLEYVGGNLAITDTNVESLGNLVRVEGFLSAYKCIFLKSLGDLEYVGGYLNLRYTPLEEKYTEEEIKDIVEVVGTLYIYTR